MFLVLLTVSVGTWAADVSWADGTYTVTGSNKTRSSGDYQYLTVSGPGALAAWIEATKPELNGVGSDGKVHLRIDGELNANDLEALNSANISVLGAFKSLDLQEATIPDLSSLSSMNLGNLEHLLLPCGYEGDATAFKNIKTSTNNLKLKLVVSTDANTNPQAIAIYSFEGNNVPSALLNPSGTLMHKTNNIDDQDTHVYSDPLSTVKTVRMAGIYGDKDLSSSYNTGANFGGNPAVWDFTGADFAPCTLSSFNFANGATHYAVDDPFLDPERNTGITSLSNHSTNAFCYFRVYATKVVDITLPTEIKVLPPGCIQMLASDNKENYKTVKGLNDAQYSSQFSYVDQNGQTQVSSYVPIETLTIPDNYTKLDYECGYSAHIKHLVIGSGMKTVEGGAFCDCLELEDLDFGAGLSDCYLGDQAFHGQQNSVMKHIALSEGIVSIGASCFMNAQNLESIRLPQSLINIGNHAFDNCLALNSITIPENVEKIGKAAFNLCPFTDIYLTTTDPAKIPVVWSCGTKFGSDTFDGDCSFHHGHVSGWEGGVDAYKDDIDGKMTWEEAADFYFINWNGMPVLHFPKQLAEKVRSSISSDYAMKTKADEDGKTYGLPLRVDLDRRDNIPGADLGTVGHGTYSQDGWAQFMLMKEYSLDPGNDLYQKEYDDVWYTMCFPFDLSDEQLAGAFNETFNIVDFSGVEVVEANKDVEPNTPLTLILHFNNVAMTDYKDTDGNHYKRVMQNGKPLREKDPTSKFEYNVYNKVNPDGTVNTDVKYYHVNTSSQLSSNKTKTFATGETMADAQTNFNNTKEAVIIDGILATAGHPYMIHPAIGVNDGGENKKKCSFSGIEWAKQSEWAKLFTDNSRTIDLGIKKTLEELPDSNYNQEAYSKYVGQKYTFIGNSKEYRDGAQTAIGNEPQVPAEKPVKPVKPTQAEVDALKPTDARMDEDDAPKPVVTDPDLDAKYTEDFKTLFNTVRCHVYLGYSQELNVHLYQDYTYGEDLASLEYTDFVEFHNWSSTYAYCTRSTAHSENCNTSELKTYLGGSAELSSLETLNALQQLSKDYTTDKAKYAAYMVEFNKYTANRAAWAIYDAKLAEMTNWNQTQVDADYQAELNAYNAAVTAHNEWLEEAKKWKTYIPKNAYFLGRKGTAYPKYYREIAENPADGQASTRQGGAWTQFTAIIIPNSAAVNGIERQLDGGVANNTKGLNMVFNEDFEGEFDPSEIKEIVAEAEEKGQKVEYMNIVYSINGEIVGRGSQSLSNLPQGMYIINGKKYLVK